MLKTHDEIARLIPHSGSMCLLDTVQQCDEANIVCTASSHRDLHNPLRLDDQLSAACGVEYAAQAMAVHGALLAKQNPAAKPRPGMLASMRSVQLHVATLHELRDDLRVSATRLMGDDNNIIYQFEVSAAGSTLLEGRATVVLGAEVNTT